MLYISNNPQDDDLFDLDRAEDGMDEGVAYNPFACDGEVKGNTSDQIEFMEPQPKFQAKTKFDSFATVGGHSCQSMRPSGSTDCLVFDQTLMSERREIPTPWDTFWRGTSWRSSFPSPALQS